MEAIVSAQAPVAIGPYSQAVRFGNLVFLSGQIPLDPKTGALVSGTITEETDRVLDNLAAVLAAAGLAFENVAKTTIFLIDMGHFQEVNAAYAKRFPGIAPARATVQVSGLPRGARVEIDAIAVRG